VANLVRRDKSDLWTVIEAAGCETTEQVIDHLVERLLTTGLASDNRQALIDYMGPMPPRDQWDAQRKTLNARLREVVVLLLSTPDYQVS